MKSNIPDIGSTPPDEIDLLEFILLIIKGWKLVLIVTIIVATIAVFIAQTKKNLYAVTTKAATIGGNSNEMAGLAALAGMQLGSSNEVDLLSHIDIVIKNAYFMDHLLEKKWNIARTQTKSELKKKTKLQYDTLSLAEYWKIVPDTTVPDWKYLNKMNLYGKLRNPKSSHISVVNQKGILEISTKFDNASLTYEVHQELLNLLQNYFSNDYASKNRASRLFIQQRVTEVKSTLSSYESQLKELRQNNFIDLAPRIALERARLEREVALQSNLYAELMKQLEMAKIEEKKDTPVFEILQYGERPLGPSEPNRKMIILAGIVGGLALGAFIVLMKNGFSELLSKHKEKKTA